MKPFALLAAALPLFAACVSLTENPRALIYEPAGVSVKTLECASAVRSARTIAAAPRREDALDPREIRVVTWNLHKEADAGWDADLARYAAGSDVMLLQEVTLRDPVQALLQSAGLRWVMASSFIYEANDIGVLTATRAVPVAACTQRFAEPLFNIPKSTVIMWLPLPATHQTLAVANIHAINFTLTLAAYREQLDALSALLAQHEGPILLGGDFNTWSDARSAVVEEVARGLGLVEVVLAKDDRARFLDHTVDHLFVRGLEVVSSLAIPVTSSDHNPVTAVLRVRP